MTDTEYESFMYGIHLDADAVVATISIHPTDAPTRMLADRFCDENQPVIDYSAITRELSR